MPSVTLPVPAGPGKLRNSELRGPNYVRNVIARRPAWAPHSPRSRRSPVPQHDRTACRRVLVGYGHVTLRAERGTIQPQATVAKMPQQGWTIEIGRSLSLRQLPRQANDAH